MHMSTSKANKVSSSDIKVEEMVRKLEGVDSNLQETYISQKKVNRGNFVYFKFNFLSSSPTKGR